MMYVLAEILRRPGLAPENFRRHYETRHVPLALSFLAFAAYRRHHVQACQGDAMPACLTLFGYRDQAHFDDLRALLASDSGDVLRADELQFMDKPHNRYYPLAERRVIAPGPVNTLLRLEQPDILQAVADAGIDGLALRELLVAATTDKTAVESVHALQPPRWALVDSALSLQELASALQAARLSCTGLARIACAGESI
jgi:hypothetical protein